MQLKCIFQARQKDQWLGTTQKGTTTSDNVLLQGQWVHIAVTSDSKKVDVYINSVYKTSFESIGYGGETQFNSLGYGYSSNKIRAAFDEFKFFNRKLTVEEITYEMNLKKEIIYEQPLFIFSGFEFLAEGLVHYWPMAGSTRDIINGKDLKIVQNGELCSDRFGNKKSGKNYIEMFLFITTTIN